MGVLIVRVDADEAESCSDWLWQLGATAIQDETHREDPCLVAGFASDDSALGARSVLQERWACRLEDTGDESAWRDRWLAFLEPVVVAGLTVHAPWHDPTPLASPRISIDPGRAFGSGHHPTTQLALEALQQQVHPTASVLDAGCGTGILSIAAATFGARRVMGIDLDHDIIEVAAANVDANQLDRRVEITETPLGHIDERFDIVVANIVVGELAPLMPALVEAADGLVIISGWLAPQLDALLSDVDVRVIAQSMRDGWGCATLQPTL